MEEETKNDTQEQILALKKEIQSLKDEFYRNNFSGTQDFNKASSFSTSLRVPTYATVPSLCQVGEVIAVEGVLKICSSANTWTNV